MDLRSEAALGMPSERILRTVLLTQSISLVFLVGKIGGPKQLSCPTMETFDTQIDLKNTIWLEQEFQAAGRGDRIIR